jgi:hypothetical protein
MPFPRSKGHAYEYSNHLPLAVMWGNGIKNPGRDDRRFREFFTGFRTNISELAGVAISGMQPVQAQVS